MTVIPVDRIKFEILSSANDDITGLYEVIWAPNSSYPAISKKDKINDSNSAIIELLQQDIIDLYKKNWDTQIEQKFEKETALKIVMQDVNWTPPSEIDDSGYYCFLATDEKAIEEENRLYILINGG